MTPDNCAFADAACALAGTRFRLHGRDPAAGIDCVGLITCALRAIGREPPQIPRYTLRNLTFAPFATIVEQAGFSACKGKILGGDLLLLRPSAGQFHLAIALAEARLIHAHAGVGRVVFSPMPAPACTFGHWRLT
jgi:cell wall-associated NlpC family hydrolase